MKEFVGKTIEEALDAACNELEKPLNELIYTTEEKKGIFSKKAVVIVYDYSDVIRYAEDYLLNVIDSLEIENTVSSKMEDDIIRMTIDSTHNPILIGKNGITLQALNELVRLAVNNKFHKRFRILLDVNGYKDHKYWRLEKQARRLAHEVQKTKQTYTFEPMPSDERRAIHNACANMPDIKTESIGEGTHRQVQILYVEGVNPRKPRDNFYKDEQVEEIPNEENIEGLDESINTVEEDKE